MKSLFWVGTKQNWAKKLSLIILVCTSLTAKNVVTETIMINCNTNGFDSFDTADNYTSNQFLELYYDIIQHNGGCGVAAVGQAALRPG